MVNGVRLRGTTVADLDVFHANECDIESARLANVGQRDRETFTAHWTSRVLGNPDTVVRTVLVDGAVAGHLTCWTDEGDPGWGDPRRRFVTFWLGREFRGRGVGTVAMREFLTVVQIRPLHAEVAVANVAATRVLQKCGFTPGEAVAVFDFHGDEPVDFAEFTLE